MVKVAILVTNGSEEMETITVVDVLRRAKIDIKIASEDGKMVRGSQNTGFMPDMSYDDVENGEFDMIVLPGGYPGTTTLSQNEQVLRILSNQHKKGGYVAAICAGPLVLGKAGVLKGKKYTYYPTTEQKIEDGEYIGGKVVSDGNVITGEGPSRSVVFALRLLETLCGRETLLKILDNLLLKESDYEQ